MDQCSRHDIPPAVRGDLTSQQGHDLTLGLKGPGARSAHLLVAQPTILTHQARARRSIPIRRLLCASSLFYLRENVRSVPPFTFACSPASAMDAVVPSGVLTVSE